jgi:hypothetical protein
MHNKKSPQWGADDYDPFNFDDISNETYDMFVRRMYLKSEEMKNYNRTGPIEGGSVPDATGHSLLDADDVQDVVDQVFTPVRPLPAHAKPIQFFHTDAQDDSDGDVTWCVHHRRAFECRKCYPSLITEVPDRGVDQ